MLTTEQRFTLLAELGVDITEARTLWRRQTDAGRKPRQVMRLRAAHVEARRLHRFHMKALRSYLSGSVLRYEIEARRLTAGKDDLVFWVEVKRLLDQCQRTIPVERMRRSYPPSGGAPDTGEHP